MLPLFLAAKIIKHKSPYEKKSVESSGETAWSSSHKWAESVYKVVIEEEERWTWRLKSEHKAGLHNK